MSNKAYKSGEVIFKEGTFSTTMYEVVGGSVGIYKDYGTESERRLATMRAHDTFGEMGLAECYPRSATAVAAEDATEVYEINGDEFSSYFKEQPEKVLAIMRQLSARIRETNAKYIEACQTVHDAIEEERAGRKPTVPLKERIGDIMRNLRIFTSETTEA